MSYTTHEWNLKLSSSFSGRTVRWYRSLEIQSRAAKKVFHIVFCSLKLEGQRVRFYHRSSVGETSPCLLWIHDSTAIIACHIIRGSGADIGSSSFKYALRVSKYDKDTWTMLAQQVSRAPKGSATLRDWCGLVRGLGTDAENLMTIERRTSIRRSWYSLK